jgi:AcrR family transcriptional regulator
MPKVAYSEEERERIRQALIAVGLARMAKQGIQHTTVEQIYKEVGISRTFFYSFFPKKEDLIVEALYLQQPRILAFAQDLMDDPALSWREGVRRFLYNCCYGERNGIAVLTVEEQQQIFSRLSPESFRVFREKQERLFGDLLTIFGVRADGARIHLFTNLSLAVMVLRRAIPETLPFFVPEAADATAAVQIEAIVDCLAAMREQSSAGRS